MAAAVDVGRTLAAYHLDKLADAELLTVSYQRPPGRGGPGAGRPAKLYTRATREMTLSVPPRDYELFARLLVSSVEQDTSGTVRAAVNEAAVDAGKRAAATPGEISWWGCAAAVTCPRSTTTAVSTYAAAPFTSSPETTWTWCAG